MIGVVDSKAVIMQQTNSTGNVTETKIVNGIHVKYKISPQDYYKGTILNKFAAIINKCDNAISTNDTSISKPCHELVIALATEAPRIENIIGNCSTYIDR
ncbi:MAG: hypothetical protein ACHQWH_04055 [Nitrososphaerales archaeon]